MPVGGILPTQLLPSNFSRDMQMSSGKKGNVMRNYNREDTLNMLTKVVI